MTTSGATATDDPGLRPMLVLIGGCLLVGASSTFIRLSGATSATAALARCTLAMPFLAAFAWSEVRRWGMPDRRGLLLALASGGLLAVDYLMWTQSVLDAGAGIATVLIGVQVVVFPLLARIGLGERVSGRFIAALPVMVLGLVLTGGVLGADPTAPAPLRGAVLGVLAGVCYAGYLFFNRQSARRRQRQVVMPVAIATGAAGICILVVALVAPLLSSAAATPRLDLAGPGVTGWLWLIVVAIGGQVLSFVAIGYGSARLPASQAGPVMLLQPVAAIVLGAVVIGERPSAAQLTGIALVLVAIGIATITGRRRATPYAEARD